MVVEVTQLAPKLLFLRGFGGSDPKATAISFGSAIFPRLARVFHGTEGDVRGLRWRGLLMAQGGKLLTARYEVTQRESGELHA